MDDDELTPEQKFAAEDPETMVPRALMEGRATEDIVAELVRLDWSPEAARALIARNTSIWSMQIENHRDRYRALTIEVELSTKTMCQMPGRSNRMPTDRELGIVAQWAAAAGLTIDEFAVL